MLVNNGRNFITKMADDSNQVVCEGSVDSIGDNCDLSAISSTSGNGNEAESLSNISDEVNIENEDAIQCGQSTSVNVVDTNEVTTTMEQVSSRNGSHEINPEASSFKIPHFTELRPALQKRAESSCTFKSIVTSSEGPIKDGTISTSYSVSGSEDSDVLKSNVASTTQTKDIPSLPYKEPSWGGIAEVVYSFEILKHGCVVGNLDLNSKSFFVIGRLPVCDVVMEHPSLSRFHAIVQYRKLEDGNDKAGFYLFDLDSTHGTYLNKNQIEPNVYYRLHVGHIVKFGGSSRLFLLQGPDEDQEEESEFTVTELKELGKKQQEALHKELNDADSNKEQLPDVEKNKEEETGVDWGFGEDAVEDDITENPFATSDDIESNKDMYLQDPKKTLRGYFEREGYDLEYDITEEGFGHTRQFRCRIRLPIENSSGESIYADSVMSGKKKDVVIACAQEACRILDLHGLLRQATHESRKRKKKNWEEDDYYDSEEDTFLDRTGTIEKKRLQRIRQAGKDVTPETYDSLSKKCENIQTEIAQIQSRLDHATQLMNEVVEEEDELDIFMKNVKAGRVLDKKDQVKLKLRLQELKKEELQVQRLMSVAKPTPLPKLNVNTASTSGFVNKKSSEVSSTSSRKALPMIGSMKGFSKTKPRINQIIIKKPVCFEAAVSSSSTADMEEEEEEADQSAADSNSAHAKNITEFMEVDNGFHEDSGIADSSEDFNAEGPDQSTEVPSYSYEHEAQQPVPSFNSEDCDDNEADSEVAETNASHSLKKKSKKLLSDDDVLGTEYDTTNPDYAMWLPPEDQAGDGKTKLNDKYGY